MRSILSRPDILDYKPSPRGLKSARDAVARHLSGGVDPDQIFLTSSTSEAYSLLFKLCLDPGAAIHVPVPGYPLLEHLARLEGVQALPYRLEAGNQWAPDSESLEASLTKDSRVLVAIRPHNPTGSWFDGRDTGRVLDLCFRRDMVLVSDEVFIDYAYGIPPEPMRDPRILSFRLGGLSKSMGLPGWKLSWIVLEGPERCLREARERLEFITDTYLSVNTPVQSALGDILTLAPQIRGQILERVLANRRILEGMEWSRYGAAVLPALGGWYALLEWKGAGMEDETIAVELLRSRSVAVHPGSFYGLGPGCYLVFSLLPESSMFRHGLEGIAEYMAEKRR